MATSTRIEVSPLDWKVPIVNKDGNPTLQFIRLWQQLFGNENGTFTQAINALQNAATAQATADAAVPQTRLINTTSPITGGGDLTADLTLAHAASGVTPGSYTNSNITVDANGHVTAAASGAGGGGGRTLISEQLLAANAANVTFSSIPTTYKVLEIEAEAKRSDAATVLEFYAQFNSDTTAANYVMYVENRFGNATAPGAGSSGCRVGVSEGNGAAAGIYGLSTVRIYDADSTSRYKYVKGTGYYPSSNFEDRTSGYWKNNTNAITAIKLWNGTAGYSFATGSRFRLYGLP